MTIRRLGGTVLKQNSAGLLSLSDTVDSAAGEWVRGGHECAPPPVQPPTDVVADNTTGPKSPVVQLNVSWTPPTDVSLVTGYRITSEPAGLSVDVDGADTATTTFLDPANPTQVYTFTVQSLTVSGVSAPSDPSNSVSAT